MKISLKKTVTAAMLAALTVALSGFYIPIGVSKCYPIQHMVNVLCAVFLGPGYGVMAAFCTSLIRNLMGTGSLLAFPGSMVGALLCGIPGRGKAGEGRYMFHVREFLRGKEYEPDPGRRDRKYF